jgi:hypothetical protein
MVRTTNCNKQTPPCRFQHFFHLPVAHILLYGIIKDFWSTWLRKPCTKVAQGQQYILPSQVRKKMVERDVIIKLTDLFKKGYDDVVKYALCLLCQVKRRHAMYDWIIPSHLRVTL